MGGWSSVRRLHNTSKFPRVPMLAGLLCVAVAWGWATSAKSGVTIVVDEVVLEKTQQSINGFIDVFVNVLDGPFMLGAYDLRLTLGDNAGGVRFTGAGRTSGAHPPVSTSTPDVFGTPGRSITVADQVDTELMSGHGLLRARFTVPPDAGGTIPVSVVPDFTNLLDTFGNPLEIDALIEGRIIIRSRLLADVDGDGRVGLSDFRTIKLNFGKSGGLSDGDVDGDGVIGLSDWILLKQSFGARSGASPSAVPEPNTLAIAVVGLGWLLAASGMRFRRATARVGV
jgi:hypothetical protein